MKNYRVLTMAIFIAIFTFAATGVWAQLQEITQIGAEETCGSFSGVRPSIDTDSKGQPHIIIDRGHVALGNTLYYYGKIGGTWAGTTFATRNSEYAHTSAISQPWIEIDSKDRAWIYAHYFKAGDFGNSGQGLWLYKNMAVNPTKEWFSLRHYGVQNGWGPGNVQIDPKYPDQCMIMAFYGYWGIINDLGTGNFDNGGRPTSGRMGPDRSGEKFRFRIATAAGQNTVWHGIMNGYSAYASKYHNSIGKKDIVWAKYSRYSNQGDDHNHPAVCNDNANTAMAYMAAVFEHQGGLCMNIWDGSKMIFSTSALKSIDSDAKFVHRYAPSMTPARGTGCWIAWPDEHDKINIAYIAPDGTVGPKKQICNGDFCAINTDKDGNIHLAYVDHGTKYRKIMVSGGRNTIFKDAVDVGGGWSYSDWFGYFNEVDNQWIYHLEHGWMYYAATDTSSIWFYTQDMGWLWTSKTIYPYMYSNTEANWIFYRKDSSNPRWFYHYNSNMWTSDQQNLAALAYDSPTLSPSCIEGTDAASQTFEVWNSAAGILTYKISTGSAWASITPTSGSSKGEHDTIQVDYDTDGLAPGTYNAALTILAAGASNSPQYVAIELTVAPSLELACSPTNLASTVTEGSNAVAQSFEIWNAGNGTINYTVAETSSWFNVSLTAGSSTGEHDNVEVSYNTTGLVAGTYSDTIIVDAGNITGSPQSIAVQVKVNEPPALSSTPKALTTACDKGNNPSNSTFEVWNSGGGTMDYSVSETSTWFSVSVNSGSSTGEHDNVEVVYDTTSLESGEYSNTITVASTNGSGSPQTITVALTVHGPIMTCDKSTLTPTCVQGANAGNDTFKVSNTGDSALHYALDENCDWLTVQPATGASLGEADTVTVTYDTTTLVAGTYQATINLTGTNYANEPATGSPKSITVTLTVSAPGDPA